MILTSVIASCQVDFFFFLTLTFRALLRITISSDLSGKEEGRNMCGVNAC